MRATWAVLLLALPALSGCLSFLENDDPDAGRDAVPPRDVANPSDYTVTSVKVHGKAMDDAISIPGFGGTPLSAVVYEPLSPDALPDGSAPAFPVLIFMHGWGNSKEFWENVRFETAAPPVNLLEKFAAEGFVTVAYDARGFGRSGGEATVAGPAEMEDLDLVRQYVQDRFHTTSYVGVTGMSYGGGQSLNAWATNPFITTAAVHDGWTDLYDALLPGNVPKAEWAVTLAAVGTVGGVVPDPAGGSTGNIDTMVYKWFEDAAIRQNLAEMEVQMDARSSAGRLGNVQKPMFLCQGLQETLFPQFHDALLDASGFTRAYVHTGGHGTYDETCWDRTLDWFRFFLLGVDVGVDKWPFLETVDADSNNPVLSFARAELEDARDNAMVYHLREPDLVQFDNMATFVVNQRFVSNPLQEPTVLWDQAKLSYNAMPHQLRFEGDDPSSVYFTTKAFERSTVVLGSPQLTLDLGADSNATNFQVVASLYHVLDNEGSETSRLLARGAYAFVDGVTAAHDGTVSVPMDWTKATLQSGDRLLFKISANDASAYLPYQGAAAPYSVTFTGHSTFEVPVFA